MRYLMVYTGNEVNMCTTDGADKHSSFGVRRAPDAYTYKNIHITLVQICIPHASAQTVC